MKKLSDSAAEWIENLFNLFYGGRSLFCDNGYKKNESRESALVDMTSAETRTEVARIDEDCRGALAGIESELQRLANEQVETDAALKATQERISDLRQQISAVALDDPRRAKELADVRETEGLRLEALTRLTGEIKDKIADAQGRRREVVDQAIAAEREVWDDETRAQLDAIRDLVAKLFNRREAIRTAGAERYACYNRFKSMLPRPPREPEYKQPPLPVDAAGFGVGTAEAIATQRRLG